MLETGFALKINKVEICHMLDFVSASLMTSNGLKAIKFAMTEIAGPSGIHIDAFTMSKLLEDFTLKSSKRVAVGLNALQLNVQEPQQGRSRNPKSSTMTNQCQ